MQIAGMILMGIGSLFLLLGALGILRMPDVFNRLQAGTKATTLGAMSLILGAGFYRPEFLSKSVILVFFVALTNQISSSVLARAAHRSGIRPVLAKDQDAYRDHADQGGKK